MLKFLVSFQSPTQQPSQGVFLKNEVNHSKDTSLENLTSWLTNVLNEQGVTEITGAAGYSPHESEQITRNIIHAKRDDSNAASYSCIIKLTFVSFRITQWAAEPNDIEVCNLNTHQRAIVKNVYFPELQVKVLQRYVKQQCYWTLSSADLSSFDLNAKYSKNIDFSFTLLSKENLASIIANDGNLTGAKLLDGVDVTNMPLGKVRTDKPMAIQLIKAGANSQSVLDNYLATKRLLNPTNISIQGISLANVSARNLDLTDLDLRGAKFGISVSLNAHEERVKENFFHDLMILLKIFSQTVDSIVLHSSSKDLVNNASAEIHDHHQAFLKKFVVWRNGTVTSGLIETVIKFSIGNCTEMAGIGKSLIDLCLTRALNQLGYSHFFIRALVCYARPPSNHSVVILKCSFLGSLKKYFMDSWSQGEAWSYNDGLAYYQQLKPNAYLKADVQFDVSEEMNAALEAPTYRSAISLIFEKYRVTQVLTSSIDKKKAEFLGIPVEQHAPKNECNQTLQFAN